MQPEKEQKPENKYITNLLQFQQFFQDSRNDTIINTIKKLCYVDSIFTDQIGRTIDYSGTLFAYRAGRQDVWNEIQKLVKQDVKEVKKTLEQVMEKQNG